MRWVLFQTLENTIGTITLLNIPIWWEGMVAVCFAGATRHALWRIVPLIGRPTLGPVVIRRHSWVKELAAAHCYVAMRFEVFGQRFPCITDASLAKVVHEVPDPCGVLGVCTSKTLSNDFWLLHTHTILTGRLPDMNELRDGAQNAYCTYARLKVVPLAAKRSMFGVWAREKLKAPIDGLMSSTMINRTLRLFDVAAAAVRTERMVRIMACIYLLQH